MSDREKVGLPVRPFLYTLDQIATLISVDLDALKQQHIYFENRSTGVHTKDKMLAVSIAPEDSVPDWRVAEKELIRWLKSKRFRVYERTI